MHAAGRYPADPITLKSSIEIVCSVLLDRPYKDAPVTPAPSPITSTPTSTSSARHGPAISKAPAW